jgi:hypothetical protein
MIFSFIQYIYLKREIVALAAKGANTRQSVKLGANTKQTGS